MPVNEQVTDSVTQVNTKVVGETPAMAMGNMLMSTSQALGTAAHNGTGAQQPGANHYASGNSARRQFSYVYRFISDWPKCGRHYRTRLNRLKKD